MRSNRLYLVLPLLFLIQLGLVARFAVDIPHWDEWDHLKFWGPNLSWAWVWAPHNEHRIVVTKLFTWSVGQITHFDLRIQQVMNFFVFGLLILSLVLLLRRVRPALSPLLIVGFTVFSFSSRLVENHLWAFQSVFHFQMLFFILCLHELFFGERGYLSIVLASIFSVLTMYSLAAGIVLAGVTIGGYSVYRIRERSWKGPLILGGVFVCGLVLWAMGHGQSKGHIPHAGLFSSDFFRFFLRILSSGFGYDRGGSFVGLLALLSVLAPFVIPIYRRQPFSKSQWALGTGVLAVLAALAVISYGRSGILPTAKSSRYVEIGFLLMPLTAAAWALSGYRYKTRAIGVLWLFCALGYCDDFGLRPYVETHVARKANAGCVSEYLAGKPGPAACPNSFPISLSEHLKIAKDYGIHFARRPAPPNH